MIWTSEALLLQLFFWVILGGVADPAGGAESRRQAELGKDPARQHKPDCYDQDKTDPLMLVLILA
jgi:hypothetical protein